MPAEKNVKIDHLEMVVFSGGAAAGWRRLRFWVELTLLEVHAVGGRMAFFSKSRKNDDSSLIGFMPKSSIFCFAVCHSNTLILVSLVSCQARVPLEIQQTLHKPRRCLIHRIIRRMS